MILHHLNIQLFTTLSMWQGDSHHNLKKKKKKQKKNKPLKLVGTTFLNRQTNEKLYIQMVKNHIPLEYDNSLRKIE
jgi:hypothetical protein